MRLWKLFLIICCVAAMAVSTSAQVTKIPATQADLKKIVVTRPVSRMTVVPDAEKIKIVQSALKGKTQASKTYSLTLPIKLDVRNSYIDNKAKLIFDWASEVSASDNSVTFDHDGKVDPRIRLFYNAPTPGFYVFDFAVDNPYYNPPVNLMFTNLFTEIQTKTLGKDGQHQLFATEIKNAGWNLILLESKTGIWKFYSVEISQFK